MATNDFTIAPIDVAARAKLDVRAGDTVRVWQKITERFMEKDKVKEKVRSQAFEGLVLARKHGKEAGATFTVRKVIDGIGVEKIFPLYAPSIEKVEIIRRSKVRHAKLYHVREKAAKEIRREMRNARAVKHEETPAEVSTEKIVEAKTEEKK
ncbi:MAG: 50S ribosomal protein L19 [Parcubacteria group bacterium GW2011_GWA2_47_16]|nr:MAG: 50S ribosomal protein L19 [Parcubacteria group bacterium GW2011_GWA2_47_16]